MNEYDEDVTRWPEDDDPESLIGEDADQDFEEADRG
jgi:hypothetical protein